MKKKALILILIYILGFITPIIWKVATKNILESQVIYKIRINREYINLRPEVDLSSDIIKQVYKDEEYKVIKYFEGNNYNWYNVIYEDNKTGWVASGKEASWVIVINEQDEK